MADEKKTRERKWTDDGTARERVLCESLQAKIRELTGRTVELDDVRAVRFSINRWAEDPATKQLREDMTEKIKIAELQQRREKALRAVQEMDAQLGDLGADLDEDEADEDSEDSEDSDEFADDVDSLFAEA